MHEEQAAAAHFPDGEADQLPERIRSGAHVVGNGELLWLRPEAIAAARWIAASGMAIWGGEVYSPRGPFSAVMVNEWRTDPEWRPGEDWQRYVSNGLEQALAAIDTFPGADQEVRGRDGTSRSLYFLAYHSPAGFPGEMSSSARPREAGDARFG